MNTSLYKAVFSVFLCIFLSLCAYAQKGSVPESAILVSLKPTVEPIHLFREMGTNSAVIPAYRRVSKLNNIWAINVREKDPTEWMRWLHGQPEVLTVQLNHPVELRAENNILPNDPSFGQQYYLYNTGQAGGVIGADIGANTAWDITKGGTTATGDSVVVAVIDGGVFANHPDWGNNLWINYDEIPNDLTDNDQNGYVDDYRGWNVLQQNDNLAGTSMAHGSAVSGIIAAQGNNGNGISGVNWHTKLMFVAATNPAGTDEADILAAYDYVYQARKLYNESNGTKGAFVVVVNCSFGINFGQPSQSPLWCNILDSLGKVGILTIGATANSGWDVDVVGDIPTTCPSDYLIATTSLNHLNKKPNNRAWGATSIDLGAYGEAAFSLGSSITTPYASGSGTSFAAPQVAASVGLLYSAPCPNLIALAKASPAQGALWAKNLLLESVTANASIDTLTVTGGSLNIGNTLQTYENQCMNCPSPYWLMASATDSNQATLSWIETSEFQSVDLRWRKKNDTLWSTINNVHSPYLLSNLQSCTDYEFVVKSSCDVGQSSSWSNIKVFRTTNCCLPPTLLQAFPVSPTEVQFTCDYLQAVQDYVVEYKTETGLWQTKVFNNSPNGFLLTNLSPCTNYFVRVQAICASGTVTEASNPFPFQTTGCGACTDMAYCPASAEFSTDEWIAKVEIGNTWSHTSGGNQGYQDFTVGSNAAATCSIAPNDTLGVTITPGFQGFPYMETYRIYIDYNRDGDFDEADELAFDPGFAHSGPMTGIIIAPDFKGTGTARMRVMMKFKGPQIDLPLPCESFIYGQVEDYCVSLTQSTQSTEPYAPSFVQISPQPANDYAEITLPEYHQGNATVWIQDIQGRILLNRTETIEGNKIRLYGLSTLPEAMYLLRVGTATATSNGKLLLVRSE